MSEQDADNPEARTADESDATEEGDAASKSVDEGADHESTSETLEEIAEEPEDVEAELSAIVGERETDAEDASESERQRVDPEEVTVGEELVEDVEAASAETVAHAIGILRAEVDALEAELDEQRDRADDLESRLRRKQADFQNYKKRQKRRIEGEKERATEDLVARLLDVRDNLQRALDQDEGVDIRDGVESTLDQFDQQLDRENVERIEPETGGNVDPQRHEVLATIASAQPADAIAHVHRPGYEMAGKVLRPAQVAVSDGSQNDEDGGSEEGDATNENDSEEGDATNENDNENGESDSDAPRQKSGEDE